MSGLTPEKEAELRALIPCTSGCVLDFDDDRCANEHDTCLFAKIVSIAEQKLSTEREGRERAEGENRAFRELVNADWFNDVADFLDNYTDAEIIDGKTHPNKALWLLSKLQEAGL